jgi:hypothetical protein
MPQKDTLDNLRTPVCFRIPSSSFTSVSIFSVWCYSSVLYLNGSDKYLKYSTVEHKSAEHHVSVVS